MGVRIPATLKSSVRKYPDRPYKIAVFLIKLDIEVTIEVHLITSPVVS